MSTILFWWVRIYWGFWWIKQQLLFLYCKHPLEFTASTDVQKNWRLMKCSLRSSCLTWKRNLLTTKQQVLWKMWSKFWSTLTPTTIQNLAVNGYIWFYVYACVCLVEKKPYTVCMANLSPQWFSFRQVLRATACWRISANLSFISSLRNTVKALVIVFSRWSKWLTAASPGFVFVLFISFHCFSFPIFVFSHSTLLSSLSWYKMYNSNQMNDKTKK